MISTLINSQTFSWGLFLVGNLLIGSMLGMLCVSIPKTLKLPLATRFMLGFSCTPYIIGLYTLLMSFVPIRLPNAAYVFPLYILAVLVLLWKRKLIIKLLSQGLFSQYSIEVKVALAAFVSYMFCNAIVKGMCNAGVSNLSIHRLTITVLCASLLFGTLLWLVFRGIRTRSKASAERCILFFSFIFIYLFSCYIIVHQEIQMLNGQISMVPNKIMLLSICVLGLLVYGILKFGTEDKKRFCNSHCITIAVSYIVAMTTMVSVRGVQWSVENYVKISGITELVKRMFLESLIYVCLFFVIVCIIYFVYSVDKRNVVTHEQVLKNRTVILRLLVFIILIVTLSRILCMIVEASFAPVIGADANQYMSEALAFAKEMSFSAMNDYHGSADGALIANIHHPAWPAYLANAMLHNWKGQVGFPNDFAVRLAIQMTYIYLMAAIWAFCRMLGKKMFPALSIILIFLYDGMLYIYTNASRDAYRLIALLAFGIVFFAMKEKLGKEKKFDIGYASLLLLVCSFVMMGHPINAITAIAIGVSFTTLMLLQKKLTLSILKYYIAAIVGALLGSYQMLMALFETGKMTGVLIDLDKLLLETDYYQNYMKYTESRLLGTHSYVERLITILERDFGLLSTVGLACAFVIIMCGIRKIDRIKKMQGVYFLTGIILFNSLFLTDIFRWSGIKLTEWCVMNMRYTLQFYVFWSLGIACMFAFVFEKMKQSNSKVFALVAVILLTYIFMPYTFIKSKYPIMNSKERYTKFVKNYEMDKEVQVKIGNKRILVDNFYMNYYLDNQGLSFFTEPAKQIRMASTEEELHSELVESGIGAILITNSYIDIYWKETLMEKFVHSEYIQECIETEINNIYILK